MTARRLTLAALLALAAVVACHETQTPADAGFLCEDCLVEKDCGAGRKCVQLASGTTCMPACGDDGTCSGGGRCLLSVAPDGTETGVCLGQHDPCEPTDPFDCEDCPVGTTCNEAGRRCDA